MLSEVCSTDLILCIEYKMSVGWYFQQQNVYEDCGYVVLDVFVDNLVAVFLHDTSSRLDVNFKTASNSEKNMLAY